MTSEMSSGFLNLCDDMLYKIGDYLRLFQEAKEREFQCSLVAGRREKFFLDSEDVDEDSDKPVPINEFYEKSLHCAIQNESRLLYHPSCNLEEEMKKRYQVWMDSYDHSYNQGWSLLNRLAPCTHDSYALCNSCARVQYVMSQELRSHANYTLKNKDSPVTREMCAYNRVRKGCPSCKDGSLLCDYCCRYGSKKKSQMKWGFMKYNKAKPRCATVKQPIMDFNTYVTTHKTPPRSRPKKRR